MLTSIRPSSPKGFTLIELLIVISIMAILAALTMMGFGYAKVSASRSKTQAFHRAIMSGLENYHSDFGEYPEPRDNSSARFGQGNYHVGGAMMLYQALSGDGDTEIKLATGSGRPSDGKVDTDAEIQRIKLSEMPPDMWKKTSNGYLMVDGFGKPFQYTKGPARTLSSQQVQVNNSTVNSTYDLWSYAEDEQHSDETSLTSKQNPKISAKWIKNW